MTGYTPTTDEVADRYVRDCMEHIGRTDAPELRAEFDRWLARHDAEVAAKAWDEGARHVYAEGGKCSFARDGDPCPYNPYREAGR